MMNLFYIERNDWDDVLSCVSIDISPEEEASLPPNPPEQRELFGWDEDIPY